MILVLAMAAGIGGFCEASTKAPSQVVDEWLVGWSTADADGLRSALSKDAALQFYDEAPAAADFLERVAAGDLELGAIRIGERRLDGDRVADRYLDDGPVKCTRMPTPQRLGPDGRPLSAEIRYAEACSKPGRYTFKIDYRVVEGCIVSLRLDL